MSYRLGIDVGGTFTDLLLFHEETQQVTLTKTPTTVHNQAEGIVVGIEKICRSADIEPKEIELIIHGTTAATNAVLEKKGVEAAVIVTEGFRDVLQIMRQDRPKLYDFFERRPDALVSRQLRFEVPERTLYTGEVAKKVNKKILDRIINELKKRDIRSVAVCLLHSYVNSLNEEKVKEILKKSCPDIHVSISSDILPEIKEYERMSTTVINAYVYPIIDRYLTDLSKRMKEIGAEEHVHVMQSNGGIMTSGQAAKKSVATILSGPAAGTIGGVELAKQAGFQNVITVDMGGTSFDICLANRGKPKFSHECEIGGHALKVPMIDMHTIGAGGGSIAWIDAGGALKVGPQSAGAMPGPICYRRGGKEPTVTDANLILGRLNPQFFLGGEMNVSVEDAYQGIEDCLGKPLGMDTLKVAEGIIKVINASMVKGIRYVSVEKGYDPREFSIVCFGGNGPLHAVELAEELEIGKVIVPFAPGVNSAYGLLMADFRYDHMQTKIMELAESNVKEIDRQFSLLEKKAFEQMRGDGFREENIILKRSLDTRYIGQGYELEVPVPSGEINYSVKREINKQFNELHNSQYGFSRDDELVEIVNFRIACFGIMTKPELRKEKKNSSKNIREALKERRKVYLKGTEVDTNIYNRDLLPAGAEIKGPAVIEQKDSTTLLFPGDTAIVDDYKNIIIEVMRR